MNILITSVACLAVVSAVTCIAWSVYITVKEIKEYKAVMAEIDRLSEEAIDRILLSGVDDLHISEDGTNLDGDCDACFNYECKSNPYRIELLDTDDDALMEEDDTFEEYVENDDDN